MKQHYDNPEYSGYETDARILDAIEAITGGDLLNNEDNGHDHPEHSTDPAIVLWRDGGRDDEIKGYLDTHYPGWQVDAPLNWGAGEFEA